MTYSILVRDGATGWFGLAAASRFFAVGAVIPWTEGGIGLVATQAAVNPTNGRRGLEGLREGLPPSAVIDRLVRPDDGAARRQLHVMAWSGETAAHTGAECVGWCGHVCEPNLSVAGNMLTGPAVIEDTAEAFRKSSGPDLVACLLAAMRAGEAAGGDARGRQSAALVIQGPEPFQRLNLRADDHSDPLAELDRLYGVARERYLPFSKGFPTPRRPHGVYDRAQIDRWIEEETGWPFDPARF